MSEHEPLWELDADDPDTYLKITKMRELAEQVHGRETIERVTEEYRQIRAELQKHPSSQERADELLANARRLEAAYGYEVLAGVPRVTRGSHPRHDWDTGAPGT
jgi:hypothetical protein